MFTPPSILLLLLWRPLLFARGFPLRPRKPSRGDGSSNTEIFVEATAAVGGSLPISTRSNARISWEEIPIDPSPSGADDGVEGGCVAERLKRGDSVVVLHDVVAVDECRYVAERCSRLDAPATELEKPGLVRIPTLAAFERALRTRTPCANPLPRDVDELLHDDILSRVLRRIDRELPAIPQKLFGGVESLEAIFRGDKKISKDEDKLLKFSSREPAINVYEEGGEFLVHKDAQALTVLLPFSSMGRDFEGGGTAFWSQDARGHRVEEPSLILLPEAGTAMLFGGCVTHAGRPVLSGTRVVLVASFSPASFNCGELILNEQRDIYGDSM